ncbi:hypothetical protein COCOBI_15-1520 [Coccomyxa sp. Obi]|nr:hypothetical protein COCOBI_15-1520 [Coccomyxa sp. Obi]
MLREAQETYREQVKELERRASSMQERLEVLEKLPQRLDAHIEEQAAMYAELAAQAISNNRALSARAEGTHQAPRSERMVANARGPGQHQMVNEADTANGGSTELSDPSEEHAETVLQSTKETHAPLDGDEPEKPQMNSLGKTEKDLRKLQDTCAHQQEELMEVRRKVNMLQHTMSDKASYTDLQAVLSSLAPQSPAQVAKNEEDIPQRERVPQGNNLHLPSSSDVQVSLLHQRLSTKADAAVVEDLREQVLNLKTSMHGIEDDCQKQLNLVMEELELHRTASLLPLPLHAVAPSSLILDIMSASEVTAEPQPPTLYQQASATALSIPSGAVTEAASTATMQLDTSSLQKEHDMAGTSQVDNSSPSPSKVLRTGTADDADHLARELAPQKAEMDPKQAAESKSSQDSEGVPVQAVAPTRVASVLAALHALEQSLAALHQHVNRVQLESRSDRLQLSRLAKDVQTCLKGGMEKSAKMPASDLPHLPASDTPTGELSTLDNINSKIRVDGPASGDLIWAATLKEAQIHAELSELRRALETVTAVIGMMALGRQEAPLMDGDLHGMEGKGMEAIISALACAMEARQVASNPPGPEQRDEQLLNVGSEIATLKHIVLDLMHTQSGYSSAAPPEQVILARKPIPGYRCMSCNRPVAHLDGLPTLRSPLPAKLNKSASSMLCKGMHKESNLTRVRPRTAASGKVPDNPFSKCTGAVSFHGSPPRRRGMVDPVEWGPKLPPGGWKTMLDKDAAHGRNC